ncbi:hypothetical protein ACHAPE_009351 [Trichoderma viride]
MNSHASPEIAKANKPALLTADTRDPDAFNPLIPRTRVLPLGMFFRSAATANGGNPLTMQSAFDKDSRYSVPIKFTAYDGSGSFRSSEVMSSSTSTDHLSVGAGVGVDLPFLPGTVFVHYDKDVMENRDSDKASVTTSYRAGMVAFVHLPELSVDAFGVLHRQGIDGFHAIYGDYYVGGSGWEATLQSSLAQTRALASNRKQRGSVSK